MSAGLKPRLMMLDGQLTKVYSLGTVAEHTGRSPNTLVYWEQKGYVQPQYVDVSNRKWFTMEYIEFLSKVDGEVAKTEWAEEWSKSCNGRS